MHILNNMQIKYKLIFIAMLTCIVTILLIGIVFIVLTQKTLKKTMIKSLSTQAEIMADNCKAAVSFDSPSDAQQTLEAFKTQSVIVYAVIYDNKNNTFATYKRDNTVEITELDLGLKENYYFGKDYLIVSQKIVLDNETIGNLIIKSDLSMLKSMLKQNIFTIAIFLIAGVVIAYVLSSGLQGIISKPIMDLMRIAKTISEENKYSIRAVGHTNDEVGQLVLSFNKMLDQIQKRDEQLIEVNENLEEKIEERTVELIEINRHLKENETQLESTVNKLESTNTELKNFVYIASHDLREPLRKVSAFGNMLQKSLSGTLSEDDAENLKFMIDGASRMTQMVDGLLAYSRVNTKVKPPEIIDLNEIIDQLKQLELSIYIEEKKATIDVPRPLPLIKVDVVQIRQLMQNLVANGMKYQSSGNEPHITINYKPVANGMIKIEVSDNGIGIAPEYHDAVFAMFKRLHSRSEYEGTGIGLAVCKKIVERHGGQIGVESEQGKGATFWFTVPAAEMNSETQEQQPVA